MTTDDIIELAKQAGLEGDGGHYEYDWFDLERFARLVRDAALEEAARVALAEPRVWDKDAPDPQHRIATAIRQLKEKT